MRKTVLTITQNEDFDLSAEETMAVLEMILWEREATSSSLLSINKLKITTSATCHRILKVLSHKIFFLGLKNQISTFCVGDTSKFFLNLYLFNI
jgi:hypothetical protein